MLRARFWTGWLAVNLVLAALVALAGWWPTTTRWGIDYQFFEKRIPLSEKVIAFLGSDLQMRRLAAEVVPAGSDPERLLGLFAWVRANVRPVPPGFPVVDDHVLNILIRGYGAPDQRTEAFCALAAYAGFRSAPAKLRAPGRREELDVAVVELAGRLYVLDVDNGIVFRTPDGALADVEGRCAGTPAWSPPPPAVVRCGAFPTWLSTRAWRSCAPSTTGSPVSGFSDASGWRRGACCGPP